MHSIAEPILISNWSAAITPFVWRKQRLYMIDSIQCCMSLGYTPHRVLLPEMYQLKKCVARRSWSFNLHIF